MRKGAVLGGRYRLVAPLGKGGMGAVWRAEHLELGTPAAVKLIDASIADNAEAIARFKREAQAAAAIRSTNVVQILDYGVHDKTPYIAMELLEGESLRDRLIRSGELEPTVVARVLGQVAKALTLAHRAGIVHRDLKPENIFLSREGEEEVVKVLDFGVAKTLTGPGAETSLATSTGAMIGTPYYMSPEQAVGTKAIDHRSDIWALAVIAFECITGHRPFRARSVGGLVLAICSKQVPVPSQVGAVPEGFDEWFARGTERDPNRRFQTVQEQMIALAGVCSASRLCGARMSAALAPTQSAGHVDLQEATARPMSLPARSPRRRPVYLYAVFGVTALALLGVAVARLGSTPAPAASAANPSVWAAALERSAPSETPGAPPTVGQIGATPEPAPRLSALAPASATASDAPRRATRLAPAPPPQRASAAPRPSRAPVSDAEQRIGF